MKILLIHSEGNQTHINDFMSDLLLHGLRQLHGSEVIDYPGCWYMYSDEIVNREFDVNKISSNQGLKGITIMAIKIIIPIGMLKVLIKLKKFAFSNCRRTKSINLIP